MQISEEIINSVYAANNDNTSNHKMSDIQKDGIPVSVTVLVNEIEEKKDKNDNSYLIVKVSDGVGTYHIKMWRTNLSQCGFSVGNIIDAEITGNEYNEGISYTLKKATVNLNADPLDYIIGPPEPIKDMWEWLCKRTQMMKKPYSLFIKKMIIDNKEKFIHSSAARSVHHNYIGGLLYHSYRMAKDADAIAPFYHLDADICVAGALLHDIGKTRELATDDIGNTVYTLDGQLESHITMGANMLDDTARELGIPLGSEPVRILRHIILSHHGKYEFGSPALPSTGEALLIHSLDMMDMKLTIWEAETANLEPGALAENSNGVLETRAYKPDFRELLGY